MTGVNMTIARRQQIHIESTPYYHCMSRCVCQYHFLGKDVNTGKNYEHRQGWVEAWLIKLNQAFCVDVVGYAVMSNHYHVVLRVNMELLSSLSDGEVIDRWGLIYKPNGLMRRYQEGGTVSPEEQEEIEQTLAKWRTNLSSISRFMGYLNERIAREANAEEGRKGHFWEGRFRSQALLDEQALLQCMAYVDLNPIRAGIADTPETSPYTSIKRRLTHHAKKKHDQLMAFLTPGKEGEFSGEEIEPVLPITFMEYLTLLDITGRVVRPDKKGVIPDSSAEILSRLGLSEAELTYPHQSPDGWFAKAVGSPALLDTYSEAIGQKWTWRHRKSISADSSIPPNPSG